MGNFFKDIGKAIGKIFNPSSWFKPPTITLPEMPKMEPAPIAQPKAPMVEPVERPEVTGASRKKTGMSLFSSNLTPTLQSIIGLASTSMPTGMLIPGARK